MVAMKAGISLVSIVGVVAALVIVGTLVPPLGMLGALAIPAVFLGLG